MLALHLLFISVKNRQLMMKWLKEIHKNDFQDVGKKAFELARLKHADFSVPNAFVITRSTCLEVFSKRSGFQNVAKPEMPVGKDAFPEKVGEKILSGFWKLGPPVAVRSSAVEEDRQGASFAGQYETVLNVVKEKDLFQAIKTCFTSQFSGKVQEYASRNKISGDALGLAVLIQKQIRPEASGVLFTVNPVTGNDREMVVETVKGLGEPLVAGKVQPDRYLINGFSESIVEKVISSGQVEPSTIPDECTPFKIKQRTDALLDDKVLYDLIQMAVKIQVLYGCPQDIEWAVDEKGIHILQSRPITAMGYSGIEGEWTTADFRDGGVSSEVVTPFMWSLYERVFESAMQSYLKGIRLISRNHKIRWSNVFFGRPYWNVGGVKKALAGMPGFNERNFDQDLGIEITYEGGGAVTPFKFQAVLRALGVLVSLERMYLRQKRTTQRVIEKFKRYEEEFKAKNLSNLKNEDLKALFEDLVHNRYFELETAYFKTVFNTANARLEFKAIFDKANKKGACFEYLPLITALRPLKPVIPLFELWNISRRVRNDPKAMRVLESGTTDKIFEHPTLGKTLKNFIKKYGHHSTRELDLRIPRWHEDPTFVIETLRSYAKLENEDDPQSHVANNRSIYKNEVEKLGRFFSGRRIIQKKYFMRKLENVRYYTWYKEEVRDWSTRVYGLIRGVSLEVGRRLTQRGILDQKDHIFYLSCPEVMMILGDKNPDLRSIQKRIESNRAYMLSFRNFENPNEVGRRWQYQYEGIERRSGTGIIYQGIPCSSGKTTGVIRLIRNMDEVDKLRSGDILVTRFTDPGWTPLFPLISGVITETGGILSHAAVIAREYGVPAVLAVLNATSILEDGQSVILDGNKGEVKVLC